MKDHAGTLDPILGVIRRVWRRFGLAILILFAEAISIAEAGAQIVSRSTPRDGAYFYRLTVDLEYHGEPMRIDVVVACGARVFGDGRSWTVERLPDLYAVRTKDGKAVLVQTPDVCQGETTASTHVPPDFLPIVVVYQNADDMKFGVGYFSEDAYENPLSELKFRGATVARSSRGEWESWRRTAPPNALRPEMRPVDPIWSLDRPHFSPRCFGMRRLPLPPEVQAIVNIHWPDTRPRYWQPPLYVQSRLDEVMLSATGGSGARYDGRGWTAYTVGGRDQSRGLPTRVAGGVVRTNPQASGSKVPAPIYPSQQDLGMPWLKPRQSDQEPLFHDLDMRGGATKGMLYCYTFALAVPQAEEALARLIRDFRTRPRTCRIDGEPVQSAGDCRTQGMIFERADAVFADHYSTIGDYPGGSE